MTLILIVIFVALVFEYINGFHDTASSIATKVLSPRQAVVLAAATNLLGALGGSAVAKTVAAGLGHQDRHLRNPGLRVAGRHRVESHHLVARPALQFLTRLGLLVLAIRTAGWIQ